MSNDLLYQMNESLDIGWNRYSNQKQRLYIGWKSGFPPTKNKLIFWSSNQNQIFFQYSTKNNTDFVFWLDLILNNFVFQPKSDIFLVFQPKTNPFCCCSNQKLTFFQINSNQKLFFIPLP